jgi:translocator protein
MTKNIKFIISLIIPLSVGAVAGLFTSSAINGWFKTLNKPFFNPPNWIFGPMWTLLYLLMGLACYFIWTSDNEARKSALKIYAVQLFFNFLWSFLFFYFKNPALALVDIFLMLITISMTIISFSKISKKAAWLLVPYLLWVLFATALNFEIWRLN